MRVHARQVEVAESRARRPESGDEEPERVLLGGAVQHLLDVLLGPECVQKFCDRIDED